MKRLLFLIVSLSLVKCLPTHAITTTIYDPMTGNTMIVTEQEAPRPFKGINYRPDPSKPLPPAPRFNNTLAPALGNLGQRAYSNPYDYSAPEDGTP